MMNIFDEQRARVVKEAESWLRTPYHPSGRVKGVGVDCAMLLAETYQNCGLVPRIDPAEYPHDWHLHRGQEKYMDYVLQHATMIAAPGGPGDGVLFRFGRCFSHGGIIVKWPRIIHAFLDRPVQYEDATRDQRLAFMGEAGGRPRPRVFFTLWPTEEQKASGAALMRQLKGGA